MPSMKDPSPEARGNVTDDNIETRAHLLPEEQSAGGSANPEKQAEAILAESEERTVHADPDDAQGGHRQSDDTV
ncbi:MAG TPA: hypothetical protein VGD09_02955 [Blastococcus sp.]|jgi:hypothetical protein